MKKKRKKQHENLLGRSPGWGGVLKDLCIDKKFVNLVLVSYHYPNGVLKDLIVKNKEEETRIK